jgi:hypothetical protein
MARFGRNQGQSVEHYSFTSGTGGPRFGAKHSGNLGRSLAFQYRAAWRYTPQSAARLITRQ